MGSHAIIILGGALSGPTAAARARETNANAKIILLERAAKISYAVGGLPYYLSGEVEARADLAPHRAEFFRRYYDVDVRTGVHVTGFDPSAHKVKTSAGEFKYDSLIYALGAGSIVPAVFGEGASNVSLLRNPAHLESVDASLRAGARRIAIIGGGYYGVEAADCLARRGCSVTLLERSAQLLPQFSEPLATRAKNALGAQGVSVLLGTEVLGVVRKGKQIVALQTSGATIDVDLTLITAGVRPRTELFQAAGGSLRRDGSILVDSHCRTALPDVYGTSICVSHLHAVTRKPIWTAQAADADKTAQVAGANAAGGDATLGPTLGSSLVRAGDLHLGRTGSTQQGAQIGRIELGGHSCDPFFRGSQPLELSLYYTKDKQRVIGAEAIGGAGVDKRIDVVATAIIGKLTLAQLAHVDLGYSPPYSTARDIVSAAAVIGQQAREVRAWSLAEFSAREPSVAVYDVRSAGERKRSAFAAPALDLTRVRAQRKQLARKRQVLFVCETGRESYLAARAASQLGVVEAGYLSGGLLAWRTAGKAGKGPLSS